MTLDPVTLTGRHVRLEPLERRHVGRLAEIGLAGDVFRWFPEPVTSPQDMADFVETALRDQASGKALPFVTIAAAEDAIVGSTRFGNIELAHRRVEIGWSWIAPPWQRTIVNTEAKYLMMRYAFETLGCIRVELKTDALNERSRAAIARLGAREEGTLRNHIVVAGGRLRDTVYFSVIDTEWPAVKAGLERRLDGAARR
jgi:RimJ/RimL family protein N-acetyltransferase